MASKDAHEALAPLIPWLVTGQLDADEQRRLEAHLADCEVCRELLTLARAQKELAVAGGSEAHLAHVSPPLLTRYAERPASLDEETRTWVESRLESCEVCGEAYRLLLEVEDSLVSEETPVRTVATRRPGFWEMLASTVLRPVPALGYLVALVAVLVLWVGEEPRRGGDAGRVPQHIVTQGESALRSEPGAPTSKPLAIPRSDGVVLLELETELVPSDLDDPALSWFLEIVSGEETIWSEQRASSDFLVREGRLVLSFVLFPEAISPGLEHEVRLRVSNPGDPMDGSALFRRSFRILDD